MVNKFRQRRNQLRYYIQNISICQANSSNFFSIFWQCSLGGDFHEITEKTTIFPDRRHRLCGAGITLAGPQSWQHVFGWRRQLSAAGQAERRKIPAAHGTAVPDGSRNHYLCGIGSRIGRQQRLPGVGLPAASAELLRSDLSDIQSALDPCQLFCVAAAPGCRAYSQQAASSIASCSCRAMVRMVSAHTFTTFRS